MVFHWYKPASGGMDTIIDLLNHTREITVEATNGIYTDEDRKEMIEQEILKIPLKHLIFQEKYGILIMQLNKNTLRVGKAHS